MRLRAIWLLAIGLLLALPAATQAADSTVEMKGSTFQPGDITVTVGDTITWVNVDPALHDAVADDGSWKTERLNPNQTASVTFDTPGSYPYRCTLHGPMRGTVTVLDEAPSTDTAVLADAGDDRDRPAVIALLVAALVGLLVAARRYHQAAVSR
jgi:plastocyanin